MRKQLLFILLSALSLSLFAQEYVHRVMILNEGYFDYLTNEVIIPPSIGAYDPFTGDYEMLNEIEDARFTSGIAFDDGYYYIAADGHLLKYNLSNDELEAGVEISGIRKIAVWNDQLIITRGEYGTELDDYIRILDKHTLALEYAIPSAELPYTTEGVVVHEDQAYIAVNNGFVLGAEVGMLAVLDLVSETIVLEIDLGANGINPDNIMLDGDVIYTLNNKDYTGSSVTSYKVGSGDLSTNNLSNVTSGCGTSALFSGEVFYQDFLSTAITRYDAEADEIIDEIELGQNLYGLVFDEINNQFYAGVTDFFSTGSFYVYDLNGNVLDVEEVSVSPGIIALDVRVATSIDEVQTSNSIDVFPNPTKSNITIPQVEGMVTIMNTSGAVVYQGLSSSISNATLNVDSFVSGVYLLQIRDESGKFYTGTFIKE